MNENESTDSLTIYSAVLSLAHAVDKQLAVIERLTTPEPPILPALMQMVPMFKDILDSFRRPTREDLGPAERRVMGDFEMAHAKLVADMQEKRTAARAADEASRTTSTTSAPAVDGK